MAADNTIRVTDDTWQRLHDRKEPGDSFDDVISDVLDTVDAATEEAVA